MPPVHIGARAAVATSGPAGDGIIPGLDGLRAVAVLAVLLTHGKLLGAGWIGVQLFFVLSGFLITRILLQDLKRSDGFAGYLGRFYSRRALRIFPLYYGYLLLLALAAWWSPALDRLAERLPAAAVYLTNFWTLAGNASEPSRYTDHLWSLAVEEQFYLAWPLVLAWMPRGALRGLVIGVILAGPLLRLLAATLAPDALPLLQTFPGGGVYLLPTSHLDAFAWGAALNLFAWRPRPWQLLVLLLAVLIAGLVANGLHGSLQLSGSPRLTLGWPLFLPHAAQYVWGYTLINAACCLLLALVLEGGRVRRIFDRPLLDFIGKRSYGIYVLHFPLLQLLWPLMLALQARLGELVGAVVVQCLLVAATLLAATVSFRFLERPALQLRHHFRADGPRLPDPAASAPASA